MTGEPPHGEPLLFSTSDYGRLGRAIAARGGFEEGELALERFPDGERGLVIRTPTHERHVVLVGGTHDDAATLELYDLATGLVEGGARTLSLALPFFGYSTQEREARPGEVVTGKARARLLSSLPLPSRGLRVLLLDLHTGGIPHYFEGAVRPTHLTARPLVVEAVRRLGGDDCVVACTDAGRAKWVASLANELSVPAAFVYKRRVDGAHTEVLSVSEAVAGKHVVIYDDMIRSGASLLGAARAFKEAGASALTAIATHGVLPGDALERLRSSGLFERIVCTDSHPRASTLADGSFLELVSVAGIYADQLRHR